MEDKATKDNADVKNCNCNCEDNISKALINSSTVLQNVWPLLKMSLYYNTRGEYARKGKNGRQSNQ